MIKRINHSLSIAFLSFVKESSVSTAVIWILLVAAVVHGGLLTLTYGWMDLDVAYGFTGAQLLAGGARPFLDIMDTNPPTILYLTRFPVWIADVTGLDAVRSTGIGFYLIMLVGLCVSARMLRNDKPRSGIAATAIYIMVWIHIGLVVLYMRHYGQRDQLIAVLLLPYVALVYARWEQRTVSVIAAVTAAAMLLLALLLKPQYALVPLALEIYLRWKSEPNRRRWGLEHSTIIIGVVVSTVVLFSMEGFREYLCTWAPLFYKYYGVYGNGYANVFGFLFSESVTRILLIAAVAAGFALSTTVESRHARLLRILIVTGVMFFVVYLIQGKGWSYHRLPLWYAAGAILALGLVTWTEHNDNHPWKTVIIPFLLLTAQLGMMPRIHAQFAGALPQVEHTEFSRYLITHSEPSDRIAVLSTAVFPSSPSYAYAGRLPALRYNMAFPVAMAYVDSPDYEIAGDQKWMADTYYRHVMADIHRYRPAIIAIDTVAYFRKSFPGFTMKTWLLRRGFYSYLDKYYDSRGKVMCLDIYHRRERGSVRKVDGD
jgi:hypothetical protein